LQAGRGHHPRREDSPTIYVLHGDPVHLLPEIVRDVRPAYGSMTRRAMVGCPTGMCPGRQEADL